MYYVMLHVAYCRHFEFFNEMQYNEYTCIIYIMYINIIINTKTSRIVGEMTIPTYIYMGLKNNYMMQMYTFVICSIL